MPLGSLRISFLWVSLQDLELLSVSMNILYHGLHVDQDPNILLIRGNICVYTFTY